MKRLSVNALAVALLSCASLPAQAGFDTFRPFALFPECGEESVHAQIVENFNWADFNYLHYGVRIRHIGGDEEKAVVTFGPYAIPRRYCAATAALSNGKLRPVYYRIEEGMGLAGTGYKVEFCLPGYDRWRVNDGRCRAIRHWNGHH